QRLAWIEARSFNRAAHHPPHVFGDFTGIENAVAVFIELLVIGRSARPVAVSSVAPALATIKATFPDRRRRTRSNEQHGGESEFPLSRHRSSLLTRGAERRNHPSSLILQRPCDSLQKGFSAGNSVFRGRRIRLPCSPFNHGNRHMLRLIGK